MSVALFLGVSIRQAVGFDDLTLRIDRVIAAPRTEVFRAWIAPDEIEMWFLHGARAHWSPDDRPLGGVRPRATFRWSVATDDDPEDVFAFHGTYQEVRAPERLVFTWEWESLPIPGVDGPGTTLVTIQFLALRRTTRIVLTQTGFSSEAARDAHAKGWARCLDGIATLFY